MRYPTELLFQRPVREGEVSTNVSAGRLSRAFPVIDGTTEWWRLLPQFSTKGGVRESWGGVTVNITYLKCSEGYWLLGIG